MAPQQKDAKMDAGQKSQLSTGRRPDIIGDVSVALPDLTPEQIAQRQAGLLQSKWASPVDEYHGQWENMLATKRGLSSSQNTKTAVPAATSGPQRQATAPTDKPTAGKQESKGKARDTTQTSTPPKRLDAADGGSKPSAQKASSGKPLSIPPKPVNKAAGEGPSNSRRSPPVMSQQAKQTSTPPPASANDNSNANSEASKKRRRRGGKGKGKAANEAVPAVAPTQGQSTFNKPSPAKGNGPKQQESAAGGADKNTGKPTTASAPPKTPASTGAARNAADSKLAQPASTQSPAQPKQQQQQGAVRGNGQQAPQHPGAAKGSSTKPVANVPRVDETTGKDRKVAGTQANQQRPPVQARFGSPAPAGGASTTGVEERSKAVQQPATGPIGGFAVTAQNAPVRLGWSPNETGDVRARRSGAPMPRLASGWEGYQDRINVSVAIQDIYLYAGDRLDVEKFNAYVASPCHSVEAKVNCLKEIVVTMDRVVSEKHNSAMSIKAERDAFRDDFDRAKAQADECAERLSAEQAQRELLEQQIEAMRHSAVDLRKEVVTKESHIGSAEGEITRLSNDLAVSHSALDKAVSKNAAYAAETASQLEQIVSLQGEVEKLSGELSGLRAKAALANTECKALKEEIAKSPLQSENEQLRSQLLEVRDQLASANQTVQDLEDERQAHICCQPWDSGNPTSVTLSAELGGQEVGQDNHDLSDEQDGPSEYSGRPSPPASSASLYGGGNAVSMSTQTEEVEVIETFTQTEEVVASQVEAFTQTVSAEVVSSSTQTGFAGASMREASTQTALVGDVLSLAEVEARVAGARQSAETRDAHVQTDMVAEVPRRGRGWRGVFLALLMLAWAAILLWGVEGERHAWDAANDMSRTSVIGIRSQYVFPWSLLTEKLSFSVTQHFDRVVPG
ncbi:uncharacterized protein GIQ15_05216 [Arthroderma uncinatum]|uniref:uncharacterized protein n=1 Tax=Arthroderma uncinatum TaxID=74035 RepID=UPI00144AE6DB|nr:uncharacterized protein GIQ15_05216 [Arthroderma uncinatum]KAF3482457.1 hypothetical protein GIQ15_05216 [Arthroderma uncinatum]